eukprot:TRINITY_DN12173_c0_g1_i1.p1 TRINITY_DN12173_c0_g1~~TRINITY_DN12173_c0_g1_i1.p1  ORF type:complete len:197 (-),score=36.02 TRINITY_DN12173_c0_g1_i1:142-732(-)
MLLKSLLRSPQSKRNISSTNTLRGKLRESLQYFVSSKPAQSTIKLTITTPSIPILVDKEVSKLVVPSVNGDINLEEALSASSVSGREKVELRPGLVTMFTTDEEERKFFISGGWVEKNNETHECTINPLECIELKNLDPKRAEYTLKACEDLLKSEIPSDSEAHVDVRTAKIGKQISEAVLNAISSTSGGERSGAV